MLTALLVCKVSLRKTVGNILFVLPTMKMTVLIFLYYFITTNSYTRCSMVQNSTDSTRYVNEPIVNGTNVFGTFVNEALMNTILINGTLAKSTLINATEDGPKVSS